MTEKPHRYLAATRHPWPCLVFLVPLLAAYEGGVVWLGGQQPEALRNGADAWLRWALQAFGVGHLLAAPLIVVTVFAVWAYRRRADRPGDLFNVCLGMALESFFFALGLWALSKWFGPLLDGLGVPANTPSGHRLAAGQLVTFIGAGIYEEVLFRLALVSLLLLTLRLAAVPRPVDSVLAVAASAVLFAAAHHVGPYGEPLDGFVFLFRTAAGLYFALLYRLRGFGVAVGAHAGYDVFVGVSIG